MAVILCHEIQQFWHYSVNCYVWQDAEWLEVEDEQEKDYTGLRIANLQVR